MNRIIHLIHWGIANMHIDSMSENSVRYKAIKGQVEILKELIEETRQNTSNIPSETARRGSASSKQPAHSYQLGRAW